MGNKEIPTLSLRNRVHHTDRASAISLLEQDQICNDRIMRRAMFIQNYKFKIEVIKGSEKIGADFLSRVM